MQWLLRRFFYRFVPCKPDSGSIVLESGLRMAGMTLIMQAEVCGGVCRTGTAERLSESTVGKIERRLLKATKNGFHTM